MAFRLLLPLSTVLVALCLIQGCVPNTAPPSRSNYNAKSMMEQWRNQKRYSYYTSDQDNPSTEASSMKAKSKRQAIYPHYVPEEDNPESYYYLVPIPRTSPSSKPPTDGFKAPLFKKPSP